MPRGPGREGRPWRDLAAGVRAAGGPCWLCGGPIDTRHWRNGGPPPRSKHSFSVDHVIPVSVDPSRAHDPSNLRPAHYGCNSGRGNRPVTAPERTSRDWLSNDH